MKNNKGFTLIELLVVIAIIGLLASLIIPSLVTARQKARDASRVAGSRTIQQALELYFDSNRAYPLDLTTLVSSGFLPGVPKDPLGSATCVGFTNCNYWYAYYPASSPSTYHVGINLERNDGPALINDKDCSSSGTTCPAGASYTGGFAGSDAAGCDATASRYCYDLTP